MADERHRDTVLRAQAGLRLDKVREYLCRLAATVTRPTGVFQTIRREDGDGGIQYQIFADTDPNGTQIAWVQSTRHDAEFIAACLAQAPLLAELFAEQRALGAEQALNDAVEALGRSTDRRKTSYGAVREWLLVRVGALRATGKGE